MKYVVGEVVVMLCQPLAFDKTKLQAKYCFKPLQVLEVLPNDIYRVTELSTEGRTVYTTTAHVSQLKFWQIVNMDEGIDSEEEEEQSIHTEENQGGRVERPTEAEDGTNPYEAEVPLEEVRRPSRNRRVPHYLDHYIL